jgi:hypothetical protein
VLVEGLELVLGLVFDLVLVEMLVVELELVLAVLLELVSVAHIQLV